MVGYVLKKHAHMHAHVRVNVYELVGMRAWVRVNVCAPMCETLCTITMQD